jgi:hypothetical protein
MKRLSRRDKEIIQTLMLFMEAGEIDYESLDFAPDEFERVLEKVLGWDI